MIQSTVQLTQEVEVKICYFQSRSEWVNESFIKLTLTQSFIKLILAIFSWDFSQAQELLLLRKLQVKQTKNKPEYPGKNPSSSNSRHRRRRVWNRSQAASTLRDPCSLHGTQI